MNTEIITYVLGLYPMTHLTEKQMKAVCADVFDLLKKYEKAIELIKEFEGKIGSIEMEVRIQLMKSIYEEVVKDLKELQN